MESDVSRKSKKINEKPAEYGTDALGNNFSFIDLVCRPGETVTAEVQYR